MSRSLKALSIGAVSCAFLAAAACGGAPSTAESTSESSAVQLAARPDVPTEQKVIYLVLTDRFQNGDPGNDGPDVDASALLHWHGGDFVGLTQRLDYLAELGVTTIWITPVVDQIDHAVEGAGLPHWGYHGYWAEHFDQLEPQLGTAAELHALLDAAHRAGLEVILDVVLNHPGYDSHFTQEPGWVRECSENFENDLTYCLFGLPDFLTEDPVVASALIDWQVAWFRQYDFDGLRADTVKHVETAVWRDFLAAVRASQDGAPFFALGELWGSAPSAEPDPFLADDLFDAMYDFGFADLVLGFLNHRQRAVAFAHHMGLRNDPAAGRYVHYLNTHDTQTMTSMLDDPEAYPVAMVLLLTSNGMPLLYYGDELARTGGEWPDNRPDMPWRMVDDPAVAMLPMTRELLRLRAAHPALARGSYETVAADAGYVVARREADGDHLLVAINRGPEPAEVSCADAATCQPLFCLNCQPGDLAVTLDAYGAVILQAAP